MTEQDAPLPVPESREKLHLRIAATSDLHMHLLAWDYHTDSARQAVGLARTASLIAAARAEVEGTVLLDNGDFLQGTPMGDYLAYEQKLESGHPHPMIVAMNALAYDAVCLGNHEFNYGLEFLEAVLAQAKFPVLSANALKQLGANPQQDAHLVKPWMLLRRNLRDSAGREHEICIGVIGLLPPQVMLWDRESLEGRMRVRCMIETARSHIPAMRAAGADVVVALAHSGLSAREETPGMENAVIPLAAIPGLDAVIAGHLHRRLPGPDYEGLEHVDAGRGLVHGKPVVMPGIAGSHLGVIDLTLAREGSGWRVAGAQAELRAISRRGAAAPEALVADAPEVVAAVAKDHAATRHYIHRPVGQSEIALHSCLSFIAPCAALATINAAQGWYVRQALADSAAGALPILSAAAPFKAGGPAGPENYTEIAPGSLTLMNIAALYPFPNSIRAVKVCGGTLRDWLERAAGAFNQLRPDHSDQLLLNPAFPSYDFDVISGLTWEIDLAHPALYAHDGRPLSPGPGRVRKLCYKGRPVAEDAQFVVASNSYRIDGSGLYAPLAEAEQVLAEHTSNRDVLIRYISAQRALGGPVPLSWRFTPLGGLEALFETSPAALDHLPEARAFGAPEARPDGRTPSGFQRLRLTL